MFPDVHGRIIDGWDHQNLIIPHDTAVQLNILEQLDQQRTDVELLYFMAAQRTHDTGCLHSVFTKTVSVYIKIIPVDVPHRINQFLSHRPPPPRILAIREPLSTIG